MESASEKIQHFDADRGAESVDAASTRNLGAKRRRRRAFSIGHLGERRPEFRLEPHAGSTAPNADIARRNARHDTPDPYPAHLPAQVEHDSNKSCRSFVRIATFNTIF